MYYTFYEHLKELQLNGEGDERFQSFLPKSYEFKADFEDDHGEEFDYRMPICSSDAGTDSDLIVCDHVFLSRLWTTYWDWRNQSQQLVGFEINGDREGKQNCEDVLAKIDGQLAALPWLEIRSLETSWRQVIVHLDGLVRVTSRQQSAALRVAVMSLVTRETGYKFEDYLKEMEDYNVQIYNAFDTEAFQVVKAATATLSPTELPSEWLTPALMTV